MRWPSCSTQALQARLGETWTVTTEGDALVVSLASGLPAQARIIPAVRDGDIALDLVSVTCSVSRCPATRSRR